MLALALVAFALLAPAAQAVPPFLSAWGTKGSGDGQFDTPDGLATDSAGRLFVADRSNDRVQVFSADGTFIASWKDGLGLRSPYGVAVDDRGAVYVIDNGNNRVVQLSATGALVRTWGSKGVGDGQLDDPRGIGVGPDGTVYVADHGNNRVVAFTADGQFLRMWGRNGGDGTAGSGPGEFDQPRGVVTDAAGDVYVVEKRNNRVQEFTSDGQFLNAFGGLGKALRPAQPALHGGHRRPPGTSTSPRSMNDRISQFGLDGSFVGMWGRNGGDGSEGSGPGEFHDPYGIAVDCRGGVYVSDEENDRIQRFGDPAAAFPRCAPNVTVTAMRGGGRGVSLLAHVRPRLHGLRDGQAGIDGGKPVALAAGGSLEASRPDRITLRYPSGLRRALATIARQTADRPGRGGRAGWDVAHRGQDAGALARGRLDLGGRRVRSRRAAEQDGGETARRRSRCRRRRGSRRGTRR